MMTTRRSSWNMEDEKEFIDCLGTGMFYQAKIGETWPSRMQLLTRYIIALEQRRDWGIMSRKEIIAYARESLGNVQFKRLAW